MQKEREYETSPWVTFDYEKDMFRSLLSYFSTNHTELSLLSKSLRFAAAESLVLHTRILVDILLSRDRLTDTIRLEELLPGFVPTDLEKLKNAYGSQRKVESPCWIINKMLAHPTKERLTSFNYSPVIRLLAPLIESIIIEVDEEREKSASI